MPVETQQERSARKLREWQEAVGWDAKKRRPVPLSPGSGVLMEAAKQTFSDGRAVDMEPARQAFAGRRAVDFALFHLMHPEHNLALRISGARDVTAEENLSSLDLFSFMNPGASSSVRLAGRSEPLSGDALMSYGGVTVESIETRVEDRSVILRGKLGRHELALAFNVAEGQVPTTVTVPHRQFHDSRGFARTSYLYFKGDMLRQKFADKDELDFMKTGKKKPKSRQNSASVAEKRQKPKSKMVRLYIKTGPEKPGV